MIEEIQIEKKQAAVLFIDVKETFDYVSKRQFIKQMIELKIDRDLIKQTKSFFIGQTLQFVINRCKNLEKKIETKIF